MGLNYISQNGTEKPAKELGMRCNCKSKTTACLDLTEEERQEISTVKVAFRVSQKRAFIQGLLEKFEPKQRYSKTETTPKKAFTWNYHLKRECEVQQKYLVKGHTHMEVDSMHSLIEKKAKEHSYLFSNGLPYHLQNFKDISQTL
ncbi:hypothetical protein PoB_000042300 [Plakobranchus ocellatus]|uniref:Uncharacterized protein n=1 Tax=Plakobranchus ocellatus TaxID=259542 RepID=A0AAV3XUC5_9GAST|nr:hypothetical protein PoB_000042300 [Plakobranchus ocellatus]